MQAFFFLLINDMTELLHYLQSHPWVAYSFAGVVGLAIGSFLNVVIYRLPKMMENEWRCQCREILELPEEPVEKLTLSTPNSSCPHCGHAIKPWENIPVISYLVLKGKCSGCGTSISPRYPLVEITTGVLSVVTLCVLGINLAGVLALPLVWTLIALTMIDYDTKLLPDDMTLPLVWTGLIINAFGVFTTLESALWGAIAGYLSLWTVYQGFKLLTGKEGMGFGDFKLLAALGAWMGWQFVPLIIILSSFVGAFIGIGLILFQGRDRNTQIPYGPYLAIAGWIALLWGNEIIALYWSTMLPPPVA